MRPQNNGINQIFNYVELKLPRIPIFNLHVTAISTGNDWVAAVIYFTSTGDTWAEEDASLSLL
jgi:ribosome-binding factor A